MSTNDAAKNGPNRREFDDADGEVARPAPARRRPWVVRFLRDPRYETGRTVLQVVPLALMIWVYAEREQIVYPKGPNISNVPVTFLKTGNRIVTPADRGRTPTVSLRVSGPQEAIERAQDQLRNPQSGLQIALENPEPDPHREVNVVQEVQNLPIFKANGLTVDDAQPAELYVNVDLEAEDVLTVQLSNRAAADLNLTGPITFTPDKVRVTGPRSLLHPAGRLKPPPAEANLSAGDDAPRTPGAHDGVRFTLSFPGAADDPRVTFEPVTVSAKYTVQAARVPYTLKLVPVKLLVSPQTLREYDVPVPDVTVGGVRVTGPPDQIARLKERDDNPEASRASDPDLPIPIAVVAVDPEDARENRTEKGIDIQNLPPGVTVDPQGPVRTVKFRIVRRDAAGGP